jgi:hypothetical protein
VKNAVKNVLAFFVTIIVGVTVGTALLTIETVERLEMDARDRSARHRTQ